MKDLCTTEIRVLKVMPDSLDSAGAEASQLWFLPTSQKGDHLSLTDYTEVDFRRSRVLKNLVLLPGRGALNERIWLQFS